MTGEIQKTPKHKMSEGGRRDILVLILIIAVILAVLGYFLYDGYLKKKAENTTICPEHKDIWVVMARIVLMT